MVIDSLSSLQQYHAAIRMAHDTYDASKAVAYVTAFRSAIRDTAYDKDLSLRASYFADEMQYLLVQQLQDLLQREIIRAERLISYLARMDDFAVLMDDKSFDPDKKFALLASGNHGKR